MDEKIFGCFLPDIHRQDERQFGFEVEIKSCNLYLAGCNGPQAKPLREHAHPMSVTKRSVQENVNLYFCYSDDSMKVCCYSLGVL